MIEALSVVPTTEMKGVSVIIPVYNRERMLSEAIESVLTQEYAGPLEIIVSDDGSTDRSVSVAMSYVPSARVVERPASSTGRGAASARNRGLSAATQPYIAFLDSDDFYLPGHLSRAVSALNAEAGCAYVFCRMLVMREQAGQRLFKRWTRKRITKRETRNLSVCAGNIVLTNAFVFRREVFTTVGGFNESYSNGEDMDLWMRISEQYAGCFSDHYGAVYRQSHSTDQLTNVSEESKWKCAVDICDGAMRRYHGLGLRDRYRLFRLRLIRAGLAGRGGLGFSKLCRLIRVGVYHPVFASVAASESAWQRLCRTETDEWKSLDEILK